MSDLLLQLLKHLRLLEEGSSYVLDYDNQVIPTEKYDAKRTYKQCDGYQPGIASIGDLPVYVEMRNGNSQAKYLQHETLGRMFSHLEKHRIKIGKARMDSASYQKEVIEMSEKHSEKFYIGAMRCDYMFDLMGQLNDWKKITIGVKDYEGTSTEYAPFGNEKTYRLVISRELKDDAQGNLFTKDNCVYRGILTNDYENTSEEVLRFYNQRGASENIFDVMNNDFCWNRLPFSFMNQNLIFMIIMMMCRAIYKWALQMWCKKIDFIKENFRLKKFIFRLINVAGKWLYRSRQNILKLYTDKKYELII